MADDFSPIAPERMQEYLDNSCSRLGLIVIDRTDFQDLAAMLERFVSIREWCHDADESARHEYDRAADDAADLLRSLKAKEARDGTE